MGQLCVDNLKSWFSKGRPLTPVPETPWKPKKSAAKAKKPAARKAKPVAKKPAARKRTR